MGNSLTSFKDKIKKLNPFGKEEVKDEIDMEDDPLPLRIVERKEWTSVKPKWRQQLETPVSLFILRTFTDSPECYGDEFCFPILRELQRRHIEKGMPDIAYNFMVGADGTVYEGRGWTTKPTKMDWNTQQYHGKSIDIAYIGDWKKDYPHDAMCEAVCRLIWLGTRLGHATTMWEVIEVRNNPPWNGVDGIVVDDSPKIYEPDDQPTLPPVDSPSPAC